MREKPIARIKKKPAWFGRTMKFLVPLVVTAGLCWLMFRQINFSDMLHVIRTQCNFWWIALALFIGVCAMVFRAFRWNIQLQALGIHAPMKALILSIFGTFAVNIVFPRLGEIWRTGYISQRQNAPFSAVFGSMIADRLADTLTVLLLLIITFAIASGHLISYLEDHKEMYQSIMSIVSSPWLWIAILAFIGVAWWSLTRRSKSGSLISKIQEFAKGLWKGFAVISTMRGKGRWLLYTVGIWGCYFLQLYAGFHAFPFTSVALNTYGIIVALVAFALSSLSMGVPSNGGIGPYQWAIIFALAPYGIGSTDAMAFASLQLGTQTLMVMLLGIFTFVNIMLDRRRLIN